MFSRALFSMPVLCSAVLLSACAHGPRSFSAEPVSAKAGAFDAILEALSRQGIASGLVDREAGTVVTRWFDTGYRFREIDADGTIEHYTDVFLRHRISVSDDAGKVRVSLTTEVQRCAPLDAVITATGVQGTCRPLDVVFPAQQTQIDRLGEMLRAAVASQHSRA